MQMIEKEYLIHQELKDKNEDSIQFNFHPIKIFAHFISGRQKILNIFLPKNKIS